MRGLRLPEVSAGEFLEMFVELANVMVIELLQALPTDLDDASRGVCVQAFERGRSSILFELTLKMVSSYMEPPGLIFAIAHHKWSKQRFFLRLCLECDCNHEAFIELRSAPLCNQAIMFLEGDGTDLIDYLELSVFVSKYKWGFSSERAVEAGHSSVNRTSWGARSRTEAYDALALRMPALKQEIEDSAGMERYLDAVALCRNPAKAVAALGMSSHPALDKLKHPWNKEFRRVVYHSDHYTLYGLTPPVIQVGRDFGPRPDADDPAAAAPFPNGAAAAPPAGPADLDVPALSDPASVLGGASAASAAARGR